jgi:hypothetical protein
MKTLGKCFTLALLLAGPGAFAQTEGEEQFDIPDSYMQEQDQVADDPGVSSYNIAGEEGTETTEDGAWKEEGYGYGYGQETETINIYSGKHDGNNVVRTVEVKLPDGTGSFSYREYQPH